MRQLRRMKQTRLRPILIQPRVVTIQTPDEEHPHPEGIPEVSWGAAVSYQGEIWPATSRRQIEQYGDRISGIQNMRIEGDYTIEIVGKTPTVVIGSSSIKPGDGVHVYAAADADPDYVILGFTEYGPLTMEIEHRV